MQHSRYLIGFENHLAGNWPRLWYHQPHIALFGCVFGVVASWGTVNVPYFFSSSDITKISVALLFVPQYIIFIFWFLRVIRMHFPSNVIEYRTLPRFTIVLMTLVIIFLGPLVFCWKFEEFAEIHQLYSTFLFQLVFASGAMICARASGSPISFIIASILVAAFLAGAIYLVTLGAGTIVIMFVLSCIIVTALLRLCLCLHAGSRTLLADILIFSGVLLMLVGIAFWVLLMATNLLTSAAPPPWADKDPAELLRWASKLDSRKYWLSALAAAIWVDLSNVVLIRYWLLPEVET
jgi:hypothetical protein